MVVCRYYLQGNCRFGSNCRNEHPANQGGGGSSGNSNGGFGNQNRFGALSNPSTNRFGGASDNSKPYNLNLADIKLDLGRGQGRPIWVLSTYGAGRNTPASLFDGNEFSPEELRVRFYEMANKGQEAQADAEAVELWNNAERDMDNVANHVDDITKFMEEAENKHPNRYDFLKTDGTRSREELAKAAETVNTSSTPFGNTNAFGQSTNNTNPFAKPAAATFGQPTGPSAFGGSTFGKTTQPSGFGQPAFGQSAFGASSTSNNQPTGGFGQSSGTSAFGQPATASTFGKPSFGNVGFGQSAFGQAAQPSTVSAFGQSTQSPTQSSFGQPSATPAFGQSAFGQAAKPNPFAAPAASSGFGQSAFGQPAQASPAFGQSTQPTSAFGQTSQPGSGFGQSAFGQTAQPSPFGQSAFGQPAQPAGSSSFGQSANTASGFGATNTPISTFGQPLQQNVSPFAQATQPKTTEVAMDSGALSSATTQVPAAANPFKMPQQAAPAAQPINSMTASNSPSAAADSNANISQGSVQVSMQNRKPLHYTETLPQGTAQMNMSQRVISYRGQQVQYLGEGDDMAPCYRRPDGKGPEKIWFPEAGSTQDVVALKKEEKLSDLQAEINKYTDEVKAQWKHLFEQGTFKDGQMPLVPPMHEWCVYDF